MLLRELLEWIDHAAPDQRADAAAALARAYLHIQSNPQTGQSAELAMPVISVEAAMTFLLDDPSPDVRQALADVLAASPSAPAHIVVSLAADAPAVAAVVLARSPLLIDADLVEIIKGGSPLLQAAIASRAPVSEAVAEVLAQVGDRDACLKLLLNTAATIADINYQRIAERFGDDAELRDIMLARPGFPAEAREILIRRLGESLGAQLAKSLSIEDDALDISLDGCEWAKVEPAPEISPSALTDVPENRLGQLIAGLLLRGICGGKLARFEAALAELADAPLERVARLVRSGNRSLLRAVYAEAGLPKLAFEAFSVALDARRKLPDYDLGEDRYANTQRIVDAALACYSDVSNRQMFDLVATIRRFAACEAREAARDHARRVLVDRTDDTAPDRELAALAA